MNDSDPLEQVMAAGEAVEVFQLSHGAVRKAITSKRIEGRLSGGTWLIRTKDAYLLWGHRIQKQDAENDN